LKSNASDYLKLVQHIYIDACTKCIADVSDLRDLETIRSRVKDEGLSFLTITLPQFCRDFERSLASGIIDSSLFRSFRKNGAIPAFLQGMFSQVFDRETGRIVSNEEQKSSNVISCVEGIRQICLFFKKLEISCTPLREKAAFENFITIERSFDAFSLSESEKAKFLSVSDMLWGVMVSKILLSKCTPKHGPGQTAEHISGNGKYVWQRWHDRLEPYFPVVDNAYPLGISCQLQELNLLSIVPEDQEQPVRVVSVPKTLKSPRIIAIEPCCMQYVQQGIRSALYRAVEYKNWFSSGHVNFTDQSINQKLANDSSITGQLATIDLSDASDRVPHDLAMEMFRSNPVLQEAIEACRSKRAELPSGEIIFPLRKFASMGSALCFPVEAMYFYTICVVALLEIQNLPETRRNVFNVSRDVYVYGDDIVVPSAYAIVVLDYLRKYNCKVNADKTFLSGNFRESCGEDAFQGERVTPVYLKKIVPENKQDADALISWCSSANALYKKGYWRTSSLLFRYVERILGPMPYVSETSAALGRNSYLGYRSTERWNRDLQRFEIKAWVASPVYRTDKLDSYGALMKSFLSRYDHNNDLPPTDPRHLERSALHGAVTLKRRWVPSQ